MTTADGSALRIRVLTVLIIVGVFVSGALVGAVLYRWGASGAAPDAPHGHGASLWLPLRELDLTPEQEARVKGIVDRRRSELEAIVQESFPRVRAVDAQMQREVREVLSPAQRKKLEALARSGPLGPTPTWQKRLDDAEADPAPPPGAGPPR